MNAQTVEIVTCAPCARYILTADGDPARGDYVNACDDAGHGHELWHDSGELGTGKRPAPGASCHFCHESAESGEIFHEWAHTSPATH